MEIKRNKLLLNQQFYPQVNKKNLIFLHHSAGTSADGAISWWNQTPDKVGTAYIIERDGTIYECFKPECWGYHLGVKGDDDYVEKFSIGIEIVAAGQLKKVKDKFMFYPLWPNLKAGKEIPTSEVWDMGESGWRGERYYHSYTDKQIEATVDLIIMLKNKFNIPVQTDLSKFFEFNEDIYKKKLSGIYSHSSVRKDKNDIIPYKPFIDKLLSGLGTIIKSDNKGKKTT